jgi:hypothetical protein
MAADILRKMRAELSRLLVLDGQAPELGEVKLALIQGGAAVLVGLKGPCPTNYQSRAKLFHVQSSSTGGQTPG